MTIRLQRQPGTFDIDALLFRQLLEQERPGSVDSHVIDLSSEPAFTYGEWKAIEHRKGGLLDLTNASISLFRTEGGIPNSSFRKAFADKPVLNANVLDYYLEHPEIIPEAWKKQLVGFWGTVYQYPDGDQAIRSLNRMAGEWVWSWRPIAPRRDYDCREAATVVMLDR